MKCLKNESRPQYNIVDSVDRQAYLESRNKVINKSWVTDLWMRVIQKSIDDIILFRKARICGKKLSEEDKFNEFTAKEFIFNDDYKIPLDDYLIDITCNKCHKEYRTYISDVAGSNILCPHCNKTSSWNHVNYIIVEDQGLFDISQDQ